MLCLSVAVWKEYVDVLHRKKFSKYASFIDNADIVLSKMLDISLYYKPTVTIDVLKDKADNKFLELSVTSNSEYLITGNKNDFKMKVYNTTKIVSPKEFWQKYKPI